MPISKQGWELHVVRKTVQRRKNGKARVRTVGSYQVYHDGVAQTGKDLSGSMAECGGPGANSPVGNGKRIEAKTYPIATHAGQKYVTYGYKNSVSTAVLPKPGILLTNTGDREGIVIHPGLAFVASIGCLNPCTSLPNSDELITYSRSRERVIALIEDLKHYLGSKFPKTNGIKIPNAHVVIDGEPA